MTYLSNRIKIDKWKRSLVFSMISAVVIAVTYLRPPSDTNYAGAIFSYNIGFFFPMLAVSSIFGLIALIYLIRFVKDLKEYEIRYKRLRILSTSLLLLPLLIHLIPLLFFLLVPIN